MLLFLLDPKLPPTFEDPGVRDLAEPYLMSVNSRFLTDLEAKYFEQGVSWSSAITERIQVEDMNVGSGSSLDGSRLAQPYKVATKVRIEE